MTINANTKIAALLKHNSDALEAIVSLSPRFTKLRNPVLRKLVAGRTSIVMASKMGGCTVDEFFEKLHPLGFEIDKDAPVADLDDEEKTLPAFMKDIQAGQTIELDVRPVIASGQDPLKIILQKLESLDTGKIFKIVNSFEPTPLIALLRKKGFESYSEVIGDDLVNTYFYKSTGKSIALQGNAPAKGEDWESIMVRFSGQLLSIDVRKLEMPLPMYTILDALETLPAGKALFVYHKRIPVFLLPELEERGFSCRIKEIGEAEVHLLIYKN